MVKEIQLRVNLIEERKENILFFKASKKLNLDTNEISAVKVLRKSIDARKKEIIFNYKVAVYIDEQIPEKSVDENGDILASIVLENVTGSFTGNLNNGLSSGSYSVSSRDGVFQGRSSTDDESRIVNHWNYYSAEYESGEILYYDNEIYCPELHMEFREDGTFTDYFYADYSTNPNPDCPQDPMFGTFSVQDGYYEMLYELGGSQDLSESDIYITYPDDNTINYDYQNVLWTYMVDLNL